MPSRTVCGLICLPILIGAVAAWPGDADAGRSAHLTASVAGAPLAVAADGSRNRVYVATSGPNAIRVLDGASRAVVDSILLPPTSRIVDLAVLEPANRIYALDAGLERLLVINGGTVTVRETIDVEGEPRSVAVDERRGLVYVTVTRTEPEPAGELVQIRRRRDLIDGRVVERHVVRATQSIALRARGVDVHTGLGDVYVANASPYRSVTRYDDVGLGSLGGFRFAAAGSNPTSVEVDEGSGWVYVADSGTDRVRVLDTFLNTVTRTVAVGDTPVDVAANEESGRVYVANRGSGTVSVLATPTDSAQAVEETVDVLDQPSAIAVDLANHRIFVATAGSTTRASVLARFDPLAHGFGFANGWPAGVSLAVPGLAQPLDIGVVYGLCGGMVFGGLDAFNAGTRAPAVFTAPAVGNPLYTYILGRLLDSLTADFGAVFTRYLEWMALPVESVVDPVLGSVLVKGLRARSADGLTAMLPQLDLGRPVPLALVLVDARRPPWENHQVLAIGHGVNSSGERVLEVYDPNRPGAARFLQTDRLLVTNDFEGNDPVQRANGITLTYRGFFITRYNAERPVWLP